MKLRFIIPLLLSPLFSSCGNGGTVDPYKVPLYFTCLSKSATILVEFTYGQPHQLSEFLLESSKDNRHWSKVVPVQSEEEDKGYAQILFNKNERIYFRSDNHSYNQDFYIGFTGSDDDEVTVSGNVMSLLSKTDFATNTTLPCDGCFYFLFCENCSLVDASNLLLPATTLKANCYDAMFSSNVKLKVPPKLPATSVAESCYAYMFSGCAALTQAPTLPATTLVTNCYEKMFYRCDNLNVSTKGDDKNKIFTCPKGGAICCDEMFEKLTVQDNQTYYYL